MMCPNCNILLAGSRAAHERDWPACRECSKKSMMFQYCSRCGFKICLDCIKSTPKEKKQFVAPPSERGSRLSLCPVCSVGFEHTIAPKPEDWPRCTWCSQQTGKFCYCRQCGLKLCPSCSEKKANPPAPIKSPLLPDKAEL